MKLEALHLGMAIHHPHHGVGVVKGITERAADIQFDDGRKSIEPESAGVTPAEPQASVTGLSMPLRQLVEEIVGHLSSKLGLELPDPDPESIAARWHKGRLVLHPADPTLQTKEIPIETFFHKVVMMRNNLRVLEQKINGHAGLSDSEKVDLQQYITRCYGSMTTFNILFKHKEDQFHSAS